MPIYVDYGANVPKKGHLHHKLFMKIWENN